MADKKTTSIYVLERLVDSKWEFADNVPGIGRRDAARQVRGRGFSPHGGTWKLRTK